MAQQKTILLADDEPHIVLALEYLTRTLSNARILIANDGPTAIESAIEHCPDLILMDVMMPGIDGYSACAEIRKNWKEQGHHGKIWFITARSSNLDDTHAKEVGADRIVPKPFDPDLLLKNIAQTLEDHCAAA